jgi:hypothetical protein
MDEPTKKTRVVIADDSIRYRTILHRLLAENKYIEVVGEAVNGIKALELIWQVRPDVVSYGFGNAFDGWYDRITASYDPCAPHLLSCSQG